MFSKHALPEEGLGRIRFHGSSPTANPRVVLRCLWFPLACLCLSFSPSFLAAAPVPVPREAPMAVDRLRPGNPAVLSMTGTWRFKLDHGAQPRRQR